MLISLGHLITRRAPWFAATWALIVLLGFVTALGGWGNESLFDRLRSPDRPQVPGEEATGEDRLDEATGSADTVLLTLDDVDPRSPQVAAAVLAARRDLAALPGVAVVTDPFGAPGGSPGVPAPTSPPTPPSPSPPTPSPAAPGPPTPGSSSSGPGPLTVSSSPATAAVLPSATAAPQAGPPAPLPPLIPHPLLPGAVREPTPVVPAPVPVALRPLAVGPDAAGAPSPTSAPAAVPPATAATTAPATPAATATPATTRPPPLTPTPVVTLALAGRPGAPASDRTELLAAVLPDPPPPTGPAPSAPPRSVPTSPLLATDGRGVAMAVTMARGLPDAVRAVDEARVRTRLAAVAQALPGSRALVGDQRALLEDFVQHVRTDLQQCEAIALPLSLLIMVVVFGGFLAAGIPIVGAVATISGALLLLLAFSYLMPIDTTAPTVVSIAGLGLCIDYGLLLVSRYREELAARRRPNATLPTTAVGEALPAAMASAGRTIFFSGVTVALALVGLLFFRPVTLRAIGLAGISVVLLALAVALTLVPALIVLAGRRLDRPGLLHRLPVLGPLSRRLGDVAPEEGAFSRLTRRAQRHPGRWALVVLVVLGVLSLPALGLRVQLSGAQVLPGTSTARRFAENLDRAYPFAPGQAPVLLVTPAGAAQVEQWAAGLPPLAPVRGFDPPRVLAAGTPDALTVLGVRTTGRVQDAASEQAVAALRAHRPPFEHWITGGTPSMTAFDAGVRDGLPAGAAVVLTSVFVLLFLMTGSVLVPLKAIVMNVISLGASFGLLVWVFQQGHLEGPLQFSSPGGIEIVIPVITLAFAFGLSMDYEVFLLSRVKEAYDEGLPNDVAVVRGVQRSGRIITSAAVIMVVVMLGFTTGELLITKELGFALATAVAIDASLIRMLLVPATMTLLGTANWWAPAPLRRLHGRLGLREH